MLMLKRKYELSNDAEGFSCWTTCNGTSGWRSVLPPHLNLPGGARLN